MSLHRRKIVNLEIREATSNDINKIITYNCLMAKETEELLLDQPVVESGVESVINDTSKGQYWVAEYNDTVIGQLMVTHEWSDWRNGFMWWIQSAYVLGEYRRRGVFSALYNHLKLMAKEKPSCCGIRLYVEKYNKHAQKTYLSLGMTNTDYEIMEMDFTKG